MRFLHFPITIAGLGIFVSEVLHHRPEARLLIPANFERLLVERGDQKRFLAQEKLSRRDAGPDLAEVMAMLRTHRKALEQESLL